jgi:hypothetical protein
VVTVVNRPTVDSAEVITPLNRKYQRKENRLMDILANPLFVLLVFVLFFHFLFIKLYQLSRNQWLWMEYAIIIGGVVSIILLTTDLRALLMSNRYTVEISRTETAYLLLLERLERAPVCITFEETESSPHDFAQIEKEHNKICAWRKQVLEKLSNLTFSEYPELNYEAYRPPFAIHYKSLSESVDLVKNSFEYYNETRKRMLDYQRQIAKNETELVLFFISPYLFITALALQCTKVTADRKRSRDN